MTDTLVRTRINDRWDLWLPTHRATRPHWRSGWEVARLADMCNRLEPGMKVWDIGAEEGDLTALFAGWGCDVGIVEPNPPVWPNIRCIWDANVDRPPLFSFVGFAADESRDAEAGLHLDGWPACAEGPVIGDHGFCRPEERADLAAIRLDDLAAEAGPPDAITMDVEGAEKLVLAGGLELLGEHHPIVWVSMHPEMMKHYYDHWTVEVIGLMGSVGYGFELLGFDHEYHFRFDPA